MSDDTTSTTVPDGETVEELQAKLEELYIANTEKVNKLAQEYQRALQPSDLVQIRLNALISMILSEEYKIKLDLVAQATLSSVLDNVLNQAAREKTQSTLLQGVPGVDPKVQMQIPKI